MARFSVLILHMEYYNFIGLNPIIIFLTDFFICVFQRMAVPDQTSYVCLVGW